MQRLSGKRYREFANSVRKLEERLTSLVSETVLLRYNTLTDEEKEEIKSQLLEQVDSLLWQSKIYRKIPSLEKPIKSLERLREALSCARV